MDKRAEQRSITHKITAAYHARLKQLKESSALEVYH